MPVFVGAWDGPTAARRLAGNERFNRADDDLGL
jgi:hypothetical protein